MEAKPLAGRSVNPKTLRDWKVQIITGLALLILGSVAAGQVWNENVNTSRVSFKHIVIDSDHNGIRAIGDVDGDGKNDVVAVNGHEPSQLVWYRYPDWKRVVIREIGDFGKDQDSIRSCDTQLADIDNDGDIDVVTRIGKSGSDVEGLMVWFENPRPDGSVDAPWEKHDIGKNTYVKDVVCTDIDKDGEIDVVTRDINPGGSAHVQIWFQDGPQSWLKKEFDVKHHDGLDCGDLDGDGDTDIVCNGFWFETPDDPRTGTYTMHNIDEKWWKEQKGHGWQKYNSKVVVADINRDGKQDVVISQAEYMGFPVSWYSAENPKEGPWKEHIITERLNFCHSLQVADFDLDGNPDVMAGGMPDYLDADYKKQDNPDKGMKIFLGDGKGEKWTELIIQEMGCYSAECGDIGSDGDIDIASARSHDRLPMEIWENTKKDGRLSLDKWTYIQADDSRGKWGDHAEPKWAIYTGLGFGDIDNDGDKDIVSGRYWYENPGGAMEGKWKRGEFGVNCDAMLVIDVDADNLADIIAVGDGKLYWLEAADEKATSWKAVEMDSDYKNGDHGIIQGYMWADVIGGGKREILLPERSSLYAYQIPANPEAGDWPRVRIADNASGEGIGIADIDADGDLDTVIAHQTADLKQGQPCPIKWCENPGDGSGDWKYYIVGSSDHTYPDRVAMADLNGDGRPDIVVTEEQWNRGDTWKTYWFEAPANPKQEWRRRIIVTQRSTNSLDLADVDSDGDIDVVISEHKGGGNGYYNDPQMQVWENDGKGNFTKHVIDTGKDSHLGARAVDLDADGDMDIVSICWTTPDYKNLHIWRNDNRPGEREDSSHIKINVSDEHVRAGEESYNIKRDPDLNWIRGIVYREAETFDGTTELKLDLYLPKNVQGKLPITVWIHGGAWSGGTRNNPQTPWVARHGYAVASIEYRLSGQATFPAQIYDCKAAIRWLRANADTYNLDPDRICAVGGSAGGHLALMLGTTCGVKALEGDGGNLEQSSCVKTVVNLFGPTDLAAHARDPLSSDRKDYEIAAEKLVGASFEKAPEKYEAASPTTYITADDPPILTIHGSRDEVVPIEQAILLHKKLKNAGVRSTFYELVGAGHGEPRDPFYNSDEAKERVLNHLEKYLKQNINLPIGGL